MTYILIFKLLLLSVGISAVILITSYLFYNYIYNYYKIVTKEESFEELLLVFKLIIQTKLQDYDDNVFKKKKALDNASFENYYNSICAEIQGSISPELMYKLEFYMTEDALYELIASTVNIFVTERVN